MGLDDDAWRRNFEENRAEATAGFFVAFTRAKQRVILRIPRLRDFYSLRRGQDHLSPNALKTGQDAHRLGSGGCSILHADLEIDLIEIFVHRAGADA